MTDGFDRKTLETAEAGYRHACTARFQDIDAAGFLFFARTLDYFHDAWLAFMESAGLPHAAVVAAREWGAPLRRCEAEYLAPVRFGDKLEVALVKATWRGSNLTVGYRMSLDGGRVAAVGLTHHVVVSMATMSRMVPPPALAEIFSRLDRG